MATGVASPWGQSPQMVAGMNNSLDDGTHHLTGEMSLTSYPPTFNGNKFVSPLKNASYYSGTGALSFGNSRLKKVNADINYLKRV